MNEAERPRYAGEYGNVHAGGSPRPRSAPRLRGTGPAAAARTALALTVLSLAAAAGCTGGEPAGLSDVERAWVVEAIGLRAGAEAGTWIDVTCERPALFEERFLNLNGDGRDEVVVDFGNTCTSGAAGQSVAVFVREEGGALRNVLLLPGMLSVLETRTSGYADLLIGGPGFCFPVWAWNGTVYDHLRNEPQTAGGCDGVG